MTLLNTIDATYHENQALISSEYFETAGESVLAVNSLWLCEGLHHLCEANTTTWPSVNFKGHTAANSKQTRRGMNESRRL